MNTLISWTQNLGCHKLTQPLTEIIDRTDLSADQKEFEAAKFLSDRGIDVSELPNINEFKGVNRFLATPRLERWNARDEYLVTPKSLQPIDKNLSESERLRILGHQLQQMPLMAKFARITKGIEERGRDQFLILSAENLLTELYTQLDQIFEDHDDILENYDYKSLVQHALDAYIEDINLTKSEMNERGWDDDQIKEFEAYVRSEYVRVVMGFADSNGMLPDYFFNPEEKRLHTVLANLATAILQDKDKS